nr:MAG TPA: hypothetical protein [Caudoviricetes sp.]
MSEYHLERFSFVPLIRSLYNHCLSFWQRPKVKFLSSKMPYYFGFPFQSQRNLKDRNLSNYGHENEMYNVGVEVKDGEGL